MLEIGFLEKNSTGENGKSKKKMAPLIPKKKANNFVIWNAHQSSIARRPNFYLSFHESAVPFSSTALPRLLALHRGMVDQCFVNYMSRTN